MKRLDKVKQAAKDKARSTAKALGDQAKQGAKGAVKRLDKVKQAAKDKTKSTAEALGDQAKRGAKGAAKRAVKEFFNLMTFGFRKVYLPIFGILFMASLLFVIVTFAIVLLVHLIF